MFKPKRIFIQTVVFDPKIFCLTTILSKQYFIRKCFVAQLGVIFKDTTNNARNLIKTTEVILYILP